MTIVATTGLGVVARAVECAKVERFISICRWISNAPAAPAFLVVLNARESEAPSKTECLALLKGICLLLIRRVDRVWQVAAKIACVQEASNPLVPRRPIGKERPNLLGDNGAIKSNVVQAGSLASGGVISIGAEGPESIQRLEWMVWLNRGGVYTDTAYGTSASSNLLSFGELIVRVQSEQLRRCRGLRDGDCQRGAALVADSDLLINQCAGENVAKRNLVVSQQYIPAARTVG